MSELFSFGAWVRQRRRALDLTRDELAAQIGCSLMTIRRIETDERRPPTQLAAPAAVWRAASVEGSPHPSEILLRFPLPSGTVTLSLYQYRRQHAAVGLKRRQWGGDRPP